MYALMAMLGERKSEGCCPTGACIHRCPVRSSGRGPLRSALRSALQRWGRSSRVRGGCQPRRMKLAAGWRLRGHCKCPFTYHWIFAILHCFSLIIRIDTKSNMMALRDGRKAKLDYIRMPNGCQLDSFEIVLGFPCLSAAFPMPFGCPLDYLQMTF